jgi:rhamnulokinase
LSDASGRRVPEDTRPLIAVDLGAESCRVSMLSWQEGRPHIELVYRFPNGPVRHADGSLRWPLAQIVEGVELGLKRCAAAAPGGIRSIAVDGWAVDYVRLDAQGIPLEDPFCYRDERNIAAEESLHAKITTERMRELTGVQLQRLNTVYQLHADRLAGLDPGVGWLNLPEYMLARWGGTPVAEYTNATHTGMVELDHRVWSEEILAAAGIDCATMPTLVPPGTLLGKVSGQLAKLPAFLDTELIAPACHDTASAIAGIPVSGDDWAYISSGTWSLVGTVLERSCNWPSTRGDGFTNLGGVGNRICFHRNVNGLWILRQCMDAWAEAGGTWELQELLRQAELAVVPHGVLEVDEPDLLLPGRMPDRINGQRRLRGFSEMDESPAGAPVMTRLILEGLASRYRQVLERVAAISGKTLRRLCVVGGGSRNALLQRLTAEETGLELHLGSPESSTIGNFAVQLAALEDAMLGGEGFCESVAEWAKCILDQEG